MRDTEDYDCPNLMWESNPGSLLVIAFTGMARGLNELANFEFVKATKEVNCSKIFCRDSTHNFYHPGLGEGLPNIPAVAERLRELIEEMSPTKITCVGVSAGGYAALLFGHLLEADTVHAFGPQIMLDRQWGLDHDDNTVYDSTLHALEIAPENDFRNLPRVLENHNGKTSYYLHVGRDCKLDLNHSNLIEHLPSVEVVLYEGEAHACAAHVLRGKGTIGEVITSW